MGNRIGGRRSAVEERFTRPQGLYEHRDIDYKKLRRLILDSKLAPCYPGADDRASDLEECPICFLFYPSLNRSRCCMKSICTECFLQIKPHQSACPAQCPFCKTSNYAVEYRGARTKEEKGIEQIEEQRVIEAQIRMRQQELLYEEQRKLKGDDVSSLTHVMETPEFGHAGLSSDEHSGSSFGHPQQGDESAASQVPIAIQRDYSYLRQRREDNFDLDLEDIMFMEAVWLSIQEIGNQRPPSRGGVATASSSLPPTTHIESSPSGGLARAVAALAERQHTGGSSNGTMVGAEQATSAHTASPSWVEARPDIQVALPVECISDAQDRPSSGTFQASVAPTIATASGHVVPESFEEQIMLATAVSLAEAQARADTPWPAWT